MRKKYLLLLAAAVIAGGGIWHARSAWQAKRELVTLNIHAMPLPEVVRLIEAQTGKKIRAEKTLESASITLRVKNKPLAFVLDRIAGLAGAHWSRINGVYTSAGSLAALENSLSGDGKFESAGWTKIAPKLPDQDLPEEMAGEKPPPGGARVLVRQGPSGPVRFERGPDGQTDIWSPEVLVAESSLGTQLAGQEMSGPDESAAEAAARKVNGRWTTYYALSKAVVMAGMSEPPPGGELRLNSPDGPGPKGRFVFKAPGPAQTSPVLSMPKFNPNQRFDQLTPSERVQQARSGQMIQIRTTPDGPAPQENVPGARDGANN